MSAKPITATISYEAANKSYTLTVDGRSQVFSPSDIDAGQSSAGANVYVKQNGDVTDSLTLTRPGTSGHLAYRYVGSAFWQRTTQGSVAISGTVDALVYGVETPNASLPRTGHAYYDVDLLGAFTQPSSIGAVSGQGNLMADFATGGIVTNISFGGGNGAFSGIGKLSSSSNQFSGNFNAIVLGGGYNGTFNGMFFGPAAQEVGAAFSSDASTGSVFVGTIMGRQGATGSNADLDHMDVSEFFTTERRRVVFNRNDDDTATVVSHDTLDLTIGYDAGSTVTGQRYNFFLPEGIQSRLIQPEQSGADTSSFLTYAGLSSELQSVNGWLQYARGNYFTAARLVSLNSNRYTFDDFVFGMETARSQVPTGTAGYDVQLDGVLYAGGDVPQALIGDGILTANFANGQITATGNVANHADGLHSYGTFDASAALASGSTKFSGDWSVAGGAVDYSGDWDGSFYGPAAQEVGSTYLAQAANGNLMSGVLYGERDDSLVAPIDPLGGLSATTDLHGTAAFVAATGGSPDFDNGTIDPVSITYNPATGGYVIIPGQGAGNVGFGGIDAEFDSGDKSDGESNGGYVVYHTADGTVDASVLNFGAGTNPVIELSYTSLAHVVQRRDHNGDALQNEYFIAFGQQTPIDRMPHSGSAHYTGVVMGGGYVEGIGQGAAVSGTMNAQIDFGSLVTSAEFDLLAKDPNGVLSNVDLGTTDLTGEVWPDGFTASNNTIAGLSFHASGDFYGPNVNEIGGPFTIRKDGGTIPGHSEAWDVAGAFVGKKN